MIFHWVPEDKSSPKKIDPIFGNESEQIDRLINTPYQLLDIATGRKIGEISIHKDLGNRAILVSIDSQSSKGSFGYSDLEYSYIPISLSELEFSPARFGDHVIWIHNSVHGKYTLTLVQRSWINEDFSSELREEVFAVQKVSVGELESLKGNSNVSANRSLFLGITRSDFAAFLRKKQQ